MGVQDHDDNERKSYEYLEPDLFGWKVVWKIFLEIFFKICFKPSGEKRTKM